MVFITLQRYEILSKSQHRLVYPLGFLGVYHSAKIRNFKQITTAFSATFAFFVVFITLQRYEILSKSQRSRDQLTLRAGVYHSAKIRNFKAKCPIAGSTTGRCEIDIDANYAIRYEPMNVPISESARFKVSFCPSVKV